MLQEQKNDDDSSSVSSASSGESSSTSDEEDAVETQISNQIDYGLTASDGKHLRDELYAAHQGTRCTSCGCSPIWGERYHRRRTGAEKVSLNFCRKCYSRRLANSDYGEESRFLCSIAYKDEAKAFKLLGPELLAEELRRFALGTHSEAVVRQLLEKQWGAVAVSRIESEIARILLPCKRQTLRREAAQPPKPEKSPATAAEREAVAGATASPAVDEAAVAKRKAARQDRLHAVGHSLLNDALRMSHSQS